MIPIQLTIQGLYSYQEKQTIDFTQLTAANLFGIFGSVGCGKSSILEAITFALYGKTDLKSDELLIEFIFETGKAQTAYRATVAGKRNSKNFEDVKKLDRKAYKKIDNQWSPIDTDALEQAIGLSYENFKRTIIIPQGQFQEFLQLGNKDRTQMMKELFNLAKYEFFYKVTALESKNNAAKQNIEGQLQQLGAIDLEQVG
jgi:exonuclease SbcC